MEFLYGLHRMAGLCDFDTLNAIYFSLIQSHIAFEFAKKGAKSKNNTNINIINI